MMFVKYRSANGTTDEMSWYAGQRVSSYHKNLDVIEIQADCDELLFVLKKFQNLPRSNENVQRWFGDHAKFIFHNL